MQNHETGKNWKDEGRGTENILHTIEERIIVILVVWISLFSENVDIFMLGNHYLIVCSMLSTFFESFETKPKC